MIGGMEVPRDIRLTTERLVLEALGPGHAKGLWRGAATSLGELRPWLLWAAEATEASIAHFSRTAEGLWRAGTDWIFATVLDGDVVGAIGLHRYDPVVASAELGYWLSSGCAGRGLMTEAGGAVVSFGFEQLDLHRIYLHAAPANRASVRVAEKLGFAREGLLRDATRGADGWHDAYAFGLLASDRSHAAP
jgi:RimJ/RimL family protein N-acetyltransferase